MSRGASLERVLDHPATAAPPTAPRGLGLLWVPVALVVGALGALVVGLAEQGQDRFVGWLLVAGAALGLLAAVVVLTGVRWAVRASQVASAVVFAGGLTAIFGLSSGAAVDLVVFGGLPVVGGVATALVAGLSGATRTRPRRT